MAVGFFILEQCKERANKEEAIWQQLSDAYIDFLKVVIDNADLQLRTKTTVSNLNAAQLERRRVIFDMLISLLERAYLLAYEEDMHESSAACGIRGRITCANGANARIFAAFCPN